MSNLKNVILIDDDPHTCDLFEMVMKHHHLTVRVYKDAETALADLPNQSPDVVVIDLFLPGLDGYQLFDQIRKKALLPNSRLVATTAYYTNSTEREISNRGFDGYIPKPLNANNLVQYLESIL